MRRFHALLIAAGLAAMPASAAAGPLHDSWLTSQVSERYGWSTSKTRLGVLVMSLTPELRKHLGAAEDHGVLVAHIDPGMPAAAAGIAVGDVIVKVRGRAIGAAADVLTAFADVTRGERIALEVVRDKKPMSLQATLAKGATTDPVTDPWSILPQWMRDMMKPLAEVPPQRLTPRACCNHD